MLKNLRFFRFTPRPLDGESRTGYRLAAGQVLDLYNDKNKNYGFDLTKYCTVYRIQNLQIFSDRVGDIIK
jgi:hypothetical protein